MQLPVCRFTSQEGRDKRFLIQKLCQAQSLSANKSPVFKAHPRSRSGGSPSYHTSFSSNFSEGVFLAHPPPDSFTHVWDNNHIIQTKSQMQYWTDVLELNNKWTSCIGKTQHGSFCGLVSCLFSVLFWLLDILLSIQVFLNQMDHSWSDIFCGSFPTVSSLWCLFLLRRTCLITGIWGNFLNCMHFKSINTSIFLLLLSLRLHYYAFSVYLGVFRCNISLFSINVRDNVEN